MRFEPETKWYEHPDVDASIIISARVRLARNLKQYPFPLRINDMDARKMMADVARSITGDRTPAGGMFSFKDLTNSPPDILLTLMERHVISRNLVMKEGIKGAVLNCDESVSVMLNEEDHVRIQSIFPGDNIDSAYHTADSVDSLIDESPDIEYAFDQEYGYLTSCPTNTGTAMRASLMLHLPALDYTGRLMRLLPALGKFGMTVRGMHGEGSESMGSIYQLSNQITLGKPESEIITSLRTAAGQLIEQENATRYKIISERKIDFEDRLYRAYGILKNCRKITVKEAMSLLSDLRLGYLTGIYALPRPQKTIYSIMMEIQPGNIMSITGQNADATAQETARAELIRGNL